MPAPCPAPARPLPPALAAARTVSAFAALVGLGASAVTLAWGEMDAAALASVWGGALAAVLTLDGWKALSLPSEDHAAWKRRRLAHAPALLAGGMLSAVVLWRSESLDAVPYIWMLFHGLGILAARPFARPATAGLGWVFLTAGLAAFSLQFIEDGPEPPAAGLALGCAFGGLHAAHALALRLGWGADLPAPALLSQRAGARRS